MHGSRPYTACVFRVTWADRASNGNTAVTLTCHCDEDIEWIWRRLECRMDLKRGHERVRNGSDFGQFRNSGQHRRVEAERIQRLEYRPQSGETAVAEHVHRRNEFGVDQSSPSKLLLEPGTTPLAVIPGASSPT